MTGKTNEDRLHADNPDSPLKVAAPITPVQNKVGQYSIVFEPTKQEEIKRERKN